MGCLFGKQQLLDNSEGDTSFMIDGKQKQIVFIGFAGSGKTTILQRFQTGKFVQTSETIGLNVETLNYKNYEFLIFDVCGKVTSLWTHYYDNLDALVFVIDTTNQQFLNGLKTEVKQIQLDLQFQNAILLFFFNKCDRETQTFNLDFFIKETGISEITNFEIIVQRCSALSGNGLNQGFDKLLLMFQNRKSKVKTNESKGF